MARGLGPDDAAVQQPDAASRSPMSDYHLVTTEQELQQWVEELRSAGEFAVDTETTSINYMQAELVGFSLPQHLVGQLMCRCA